MKEVLINLEKLSVFLLVSNISMGISRMSVDWHADVDAKFTSIEIFTS